jgi:hypothetical protein
LQDIVEQPIDEGEKPKPAENGVVTGDGAGKEEGEVGEVDGVDILKNLETHVAAKRTLLDVNEDDLDANTILDLTEKRMAFARTIAPIKKVCLAPSPLRPFPFFSSSPFSSAWE